MDREHRRAALARAASTIARLNVERDDEFQDSAMGEIRLAQDAFRADVAAELPGPGADPLLDALMEVVRSLDSAPEMVGAACDEALAAAGVPVSASSAVAAARR